MKAMILAAGLGTRLRPLTDSRPKALVKVGGRTLLEITLGRLRDAGVRDVVINAHHFADMMIEYLQAHANFGMQIDISREEILLDTGGGLKKAAYFFQSAEDGDEPFILHNVDVISTIDLKGMVQCHIQTRALASLAVQERETSRYLLFDGDSQLCGRKSGRDGKIELVATSQNPVALAFCGIHVISPRFLTMMTEQGAFSIIDVYLRLASAGEKIVGFRADEYSWRDLGKPENLAQAEHDLKQHVAWQ